METGGTTATGMIVEHVLPALGARHHTPRQ
jgi:hypothetical protein